MNEKYQMKKLKEKNKKLKKKYLNLEKENEVLKQKI